jgi:tetratricopeptide (TPR) repeat protein
MTTSLSLSAQVSGSNASPFSTTALTQQVNAAFRNYHSLLALSRSPLANSTLVAPTLVLDETSPTAEERGRGLRLVLRWAVDQIAPEPSAYAHGRTRSFDDPTWSDPLWWRYNILRHRYLEPLHPDAFVEGGRYTETLMALTGITSSDTFFDERNRGIQEVAERLCQQMEDGAASSDLQRMALVEIERLLEANSEAARLLGIAATFDDIFPRSLLLNLAKQEQLRSTDQILEYLVTHRLLLSGDSGGNLWLSPTLRAYVYERQPLATRQRYHREIARYYTEQESPLTAARHWQRAGHAQRAAQIFLSSAEELVHELQQTELIQALRFFIARDLPSADWREVQILLSDLYFRNGQAEEALVACREALRAAEEPIHQARIYRRMGKLYEKRNQLHALGYYQQAVERFTTDSPEFAYLLKDRGWLHILRRNWKEAEDDLLLALSNTPDGMDELRADIVDALASLYLRHQQYQQALEQARNALTLRERIGDLARIANSLNNLGLVYRGLGEYANAINTYEEALVTYRKLGNQEAMAGALLNIGSAYFFLNQPQIAIAYYQQSLTLCQANHLPHTEATVRYNLAEALAASGNEEKAQQHWQQGYRLSQNAGFTDEVNAFEQLREQTPLLQTITLVEPTVDSTQMLSPLGKQPALNAEEAETLALARRHGRVSAKQLMDECFVSRATATRRLARLVEQGHLQAHGRGRGAYYTIASNGVYARNENKQPRPEVVDSLEEAYPLLVSTLRQQKEMLNKQFGVNALGVVLPLPAAPSPQRLLVKFSSMPELERFFTLRQQLSETTNREIDLLPAALPPALQNLSHTQWIWEQEAT